MELYLSDRPTKRYVVVFGNKKYYFGSPTGFTYTDGATDKQRDNYRKRHLANKTERYRVDNLVHSPALFSMFLLWGESRNIKTNLANLNRIMGH